MKEYQIAAYLRISLDDGLPGESHSIGGQRAVIKGYLESRPDLKAAALEEFSDDGFSGTNFDRPGFCAMMEKIKGGQIDCVIVKDLSRFGRNYIEVSRFIEQIFPLLGVRFISVNDAYDSEAHTGSTAGLEISFQNLIYDLYSKDISQKVMASKHIKMQRGECISAYAIYGYMKSPENRNQLIIDPEAAAIVARIFEMTCDGRTPREIAVSLNDEEIPAPSEYKKLGGGKRSWGHPDKKILWTGAAIRRILSDRRYTGAYVGKQWETKKVGSRKAAKVPEHQQIVIEDAVPAIVSKDRFEKALDCLSQRATLPAGSEKRKKSLFAGKVFCGHCGYSMGRKACKNAYYFCKTLTYSREYGCSPDHLSASDLTAAILETLTHSIAAACDMKTLWNDYRRQLSDRIAAKERELLALQDKQERQKRQQIMLYERYRKNDWTRERYAEERSRLSREIERCEKDEASAKADLHKLRKIQNQENDNRFISTFSRYGELDELTAEAVNELVEHIEILDALHIKVQVKYLDEYQRLLREMTA